MPTKASGWTGYRPKVKSIPFIISHLDLDEKNSSKRLKVAYTKKKRLKLKVGYRMETGDGGFGSPRCVACMGQSDLLKQVTIRNAAARPRFTNPLTFCDGPWKLQMCLV